MRIYFQFLAWLLRKVTFRTPRFFRDLIEDYRRAFLRTWALALAMSAMAYLVLALFVLVGCAMAETTKQQLIDNEFYAMIFMGVVVVYNWLAAWYGVFKQERQDLLDILAEG